MIVIPQKGEKSVQIQFKKVKSKWIDFAKSPLKVIHENVSVWVHMQQSITAATKAKSCLYSYINRPHSADKQTSPDNGISDRDKIFSEILCEFTVPLTSEGTHLYWPHYSCACDVVSPRRYPCVLPKEKPPSLKMLIFFIVSFCYLSWTKITVHSYSFCVLFLWLRLFSAYISPDHIWQQC